MSDMSAIDSMSLIVEVAEKLPVSFTEIRPIAASVFDKVIRCFRHIHHYISAPSHHQT